MDSLTSEFSKKCGLTDAEKVDRFTPKNQDEFKFAGKIQCGANSNSNDSTYVHHTIIPLNLPNEDIYVYNFFCFGQSEKIDRRRYPNENHLENIPLSQRFSLPLWEIDNTDAATLIRQELLGSFFEHVKKNKLAQQFSPAVYDYHTRMYCSGHMSYKEFQITLKNMSDNIRAIVHDMEPNIDSIRVIISPDKTIDLSRNEAAKHGRTNSKVARKQAVSNDLLLVEYLEAIVTYFLVTSGKWYVFDGAFYSETHDKVLPGESLYYISGGFRKKVIMIGRHLAQARPALLLEPHSEGFFLENTTVNTYFDGSKGKAFYDTAQSYDRFLQVTLKNGFGHVFRFAGLTVKKVKDLTVKRGGSTIPMQTDFFNRSGCKCSEELSAIIEKTAHGAVRYDPQEYSSICKGQRIHTIKQSPQIIAALANTYQKPQQMYEAIMSIMETVEAEFKNHRIKTLQMAATNAKVFPPPDIECGDRVIQIKRDNPELTWAFDGLFYEPANLQSWACTTFNNSNQTTKGNIDRFIEQLRGQAQSRGMNVPTPVLFESKSTIAVDYYGLLKKVREHHSFVMVITETDNKNVYDALKLAEAAQGNVYTQHIPYATVTEALRNNKLYTEILFKMNLKLGGINFRVSPDRSFISRCELFPKSRMFISFHIRNTVTQADSHRNAGLPEAEPTMVGQNQPLPQFAMTRKNILNTGVSIRFVQFITGALNAFYNENGALPQEIIVYCSAVKDLVPEDSSWTNLTNALVQGLQLAHNNKCNGAHFVMPKLVIINVTRKYHRLFQSNGRKEVTNPPLGTCIDGDLFEPEKTQFLLLSDYSTKVMGYPTLYSVVHDAPGDRVPLDHLQYLTWTMCFGYGTKLGPLPCPAPLMSAQKLAKLGRTNWFAGEHLAPDNFFGQGPGLMGYFDRINAVLKSLRNMFWA